MRKILAFATSVLVLSGTGVATADPSTSPTPGSSSSATPAPASSAETREQESRARVVRLESMVAQTLSVVKRERALSQLAEQDYVRQRGLFIQAEAALDKASSDSSRAKTKHDTAQVTFARMMQEAYMGGGLTPTTGALLVSRSPQSLLDAVSYGQLLAGQQTVTIESLSASLRSYQDAEKRVQDSRNDRRRALDKANTDLEESQRRLQNANRLVASLTEGLKSARADEAKAYVDLQAYTGINGGLPLSRLQELSREFMAKQNKIKASVKSIPDPGHWTPALGNVAARRALAWTGLPYAWAGGTKDGPTTGVCTGGYGGGGENDCKVWGFDCSGLVMYAWGPYRSLTHYAATQYSQAGSLHPRISELVAGDLVFWSVNGKQSGIHHVAIYIGGGSVVQAPQSGDVVKVTPLAAVSSDYFGATRPLT